MIENDPAVAANEVWAHLIDNHDTTVSYGAIRAYVTKRKTERAEAKQQAGLAGFAPRSGECA
jgi:hypothetical protein